MIYVLFCCVISFSYGEIRPQNWKERLTALICMIVECTKLSIILGNLAGLLTNSETKVGVFKYHLKVVQEHMVSIIISKLLSNRITLLYYVVEYDPARDFA